jgi:outer membrane lipoprotein-sorting protein
VLIPALLVVWALRPDSTRDGLPSIAPETLVGPARTGDLPQFSGTAVAQLTPDATLLGRAAARPSSGVSLVGLAPGTHSVRVWSGGADRERVAIVRPTAETNLFRSGSEQWLWSSAHRVAVRTTPPAAPQSVWLAPATPIDLAQALLSTVGVDTVLSMAGSETVADRTAYGLVLQPSADDSRIDYVHIALDGATRTPLAVQIYARGVGDPVVDVAFTNIRFGTQPSTLFGFQPPDDATVRTAAPGRVAATTVGSAWSSVLCYRVPASEADEPRAGVLTPVHGRWGRGKVATSPLLSVLVLSDGRAYAGPVPPETLYVAAASDPVTATQKRPTR